MTHNSTSGVAHFVAENDDDCLEQIRSLLVFFLVIILDGSACCGF